jgi:hypothetical protein
MLAGPEVIDVPIMPDSAETIGKPVNSGCTTIVAIANHERYGRG